MDPMQLLLEQTTRILDRVSQAPPPVRLSDQSETVGALAAALAQAQGKFANPPRNKTAKVRGKSKTGEPIEYSYRYADLADILTVVRVPLSEAGLSYSQDVRFDGQSQEAVVVTVLRHASGEWVRTVLKYPSAAGRIQDLGSIFTYLRRYSFSALIGLAPEDDDDGELAVEAARSRQEERRQDRQDKRQAAKGKSEDTIPTKEELERFFSKFGELARERFSSEKEARAWLKDQEPNPHQAHTKRLGQLLALLTKRPLVGADQAEGKAQEAPEDAKRRQAVQRRWAMLYQGKGLSEATAYWWAERNHGFCFDPEKGRASASLTPVPNISKAADALGKLDAEQLEQLRQEHALYLDDLRAANEAAKELGGDESG